MDAKRCHAALILMLLASAPAAAQTVGDLADVQAKTLLLRAQAAQAEAAAKLAKANHEAGGSDYASDDGQMPVVRGVYGNSGKLYATFLYANGSTVDARSGDTIPGGYTVRSLSATRVVLSRRGKTFPVGFSDIRPVVAEKQPAGGITYPYTGPLSPPTTGQ